MYEQLQNVFHYLFSICVVKLAKLSKHLTF